MRAEIRVLRALAAGYNAEAEQWVGPIAAQLAAHGSAHTRAADQLQAEQDAAEAPLRKPS